jgi:transcriptional regulator with XRE-family HTH domain
MPVSTLRPDHLVPISGPALRDLRGLRELSAEALAERAGVAANTIYRLESGRHPTARLRTAQALAAALGVDLYRLIEPWSNGT